MSKPNDNIELPEDRYIFGVDKANEGTGDYTGYIELPAESGLMKEISRDQAVLNKAKSEVVDKLDYVVGPQPIPVGPKPRLVPPFSHFIKALWSMIRQGW